MPPVTTRPNLKRRRLVVGLGVIVVAVAVGWSAIAGDISVARLVQQIIERLQAIGPVCFFAAMAVLPAFGAPLLPFALVAGPAYGPRYGAGVVTLCAIAAVAVNTALSYGIARFVLTAAVRNAVRWLGYELPTINQDSAWKASLVLRLAPGLPFWVQSYALGIAGTAWLPYQVVSTLVPAMYLAGAIIGGEAAWRGGVGAALFGFSLLVFAGVVTYLWRTRNRRSSPGSVGTASKTHESGR